MQFYRAVQWKQKFKAPTENGFVVKLPQVQKMNKSSNLSERVKFFAVEDELSELKVRWNKLSIVLGTDSISKIFQWVTALRLAKLGRQFYDNYQNTLATVEQRPSSLLSLRPASFGPLPTTSGSRPSSIEQDQFDGAHRVNNLRFWNFILYKLYAACIFRTINPKVVITCRIQIFLTV